MARHRVLLVDDHSLFRTALKMLLSTAPDLDVAVVAEACSASEAYAAFDRGGFDVVVIDLALPGSSGLTVLQEAKRRKLSQPRLVLSGHTELDMIRESIAAGASGYVSKDQDSDALFAALRAVLRGDKFFPEALARQEPTARRPADGTTSPRAMLSPREREVFELIIQGYSNGEVAARLFISSKTVETHRGHVMNKLGVHSICDLVRLASRHNLLDAGGAGGEGEREAG